MGKDINAAIMAAQDTSFQYRSDRENLFTGGMGRIFWVLAGAGQTIAPWWSTTRDQQLRNFWKESDHLSGTVYTMQSKMTSIPFQVVPRDASVRKHVTEAQDMTEILRFTPEYGGGWIEAYSKWVEDYLTQDNGAFMEVIGDGDPAGPIIGPPVSVAHLDSYRCQRTGHPEYPVIYEDENGQRHKVHYTRVMFASQMSSPISEMFGVGFCSVSRCLNITQTLIDILTYKQEKLGSRPHRAIIVTKGGLDPMDIKVAFQMAEEGLDSQNLERYSKVVVAGSSAIEEAGLDMIEMSTLPDGFDEETSVTLGMAAIALAFGVDARELFPALSAGASRADALLQHLKQRGKGPGQILQVTEQMFNFKFLPGHLRLEFDFQDDAQDRQVAEIRQIRSSRRITDLNSGTLTVRIAREQMLEKGEIDKWQFERLELQDGRLPDGSSILFLFYSTDKEISRMLDMPIDDPLDIEGNAKDMMLDLIREKLIEVSDKLVNARTSNVRDTAYRAVMALAYLDKKYREKVEVTPEGETPTPPTPSLWADMGVGTSEPPGVTAERLRRTSMTNPQDNEASPDREKKPQSNSDDRLMKYRYDVFSE
jgi:hypothetical protein